MHGGHVFNGDIMLAKTTSKSRVESGKIRRDERGGRRYSSTSKNRARFIRLTCFLTSVFNRLVIQSSSLSAMYATSSVDEVLSSPLLSLYC